MASYTIEDIELIRRKSGISYQEAVALLDYHNGNVARALIDLERNGRILPESEQRKAEKQESGEAKNGFMAFLQKLYRMRVKVTKADTTVANLSCLFVGGALLLSPWTVIVSLIISAVMGYKVTYVKNDPAFASENLERTVRNAAQNAKNTANDFARGFQDAMKGEGDKAQSRERSADPAQDIREGVEELKQDAAKEASDRSYYQSNPAATTFHTTYTGTAPTIQVPVKVESTDGDVSVDSESDGHNSATIG